MPRKLSKRKYSKRRNTRKNLRRSRKRRPLKRKSLRRNTLKVSRKKLKKRRSLRNKKQGGGDPEKLAQKYGSVEQERNTDIAYINVKISEIEAALRSYNIITNGVKLFQFQKYTKILNHGIRYFKWAQKVSVTEEGNLLLDFPRNQEPIWFEIKDKFTKLLTDIKIGIVQAKEIMIKIDILRSITPISFMQQQQDKALPKALPGETDELKLLFRRFNYLLDGQKFIKDSGFNQSPPITFYDEDEDDLTYDVNEHLDPVDLPWKYINHNFSFRLNWANILKNFVKISISLNHNIPKPERAYAPNDLKRPREDSMVRRKGEDEESSEKRLMTKDPRQNVGPQRKSL